MKTLALICQQYAREVKQRVWPKKQALDFAER
jgi:hypothetical protein